MLVTFGGHSRVPHAKEVETWLTEVASVVVSCIRYDDVGSAAALWKHAKRQKKRIIRYPLTR